MKILNVVILFWCSIFNQENKDLSYDKYFQKKLDQVLANTDKNFATNKIYYLRGNKLHQEKNNNIYPDDDQLALFVKKQNENSEK